MRLLLAPVLLAVGGVLFWYWPELRSLQEPEQESTGSTAQRLRDVEAQVRQGAAAVPKLVEQLNSNVTRDRQDAALALGWMGGEAEGAVPALLDASDDPDSIVREHSLTALGRIGADISAATGRIAQHLVDESREIRRAAANLLLAQGDAAIPAVRGMLMQGDADSQLLAINTLRALNANDQESLDQLRQYRSTTRAPCQNVESASLGILASRQATHDDLRLALRSGLSRVVLPAMDIIFEEEHPDSSLTDGLAELVANPAPRELTCEIDSLPDSATTTRWIRRRAIRCLAEMGPSAQTAENVLRGLVSDDLIDPSTKFSAISALRRIGCDVQPYVSLIVQLAVKQPTLSEYSHEYGVEASWAGLLREMAPQEIPKVVGILRGKLAIDPNSADRDDGRVSVIILLGQFGSDAEAALPELLPLLDSPDYRLFDSALTAIGKLGPASARAVPTLARLLDENLRSDLRPKQPLLPYHTQSGYRAVDLLQTLERLGPAAAEMRPKLLALAAVIAERNSTDESLIVFRFHVLKTLASIGGSDEIVLQGMREIARHPNLMISTPALELLFTNDPDPDLPIAILAEHLDRLAADPQPALSQRWLPPSLLERLAAAGPRGAPCILPLAHAADSLPWQGALLETLTILLKAQGAWSASDPIVGEIVPQMTEYLSENASADSYGALSVLAALGPAAADAVPALEAALARAPDDAEARREIFNTGRPLPQVGDIAFASGRSVDVPLATYVDHLRSALDRIRLAAPQSAD